MTTTLNRPSTDKGSRASKGAIACGVGFGALSMTCCSVGILGAVTWGVGVSAGFFAFDQISPIGSTPVVVFVAFALTALVAWLVMRRRAAGLPREVARSVLRRGIGGALLSSGVTYFVLMQFVMPVLYATGLLHMGMFFMR